MMVKAFVVFLCTLSSKNATDYDRYLDRSSGLSARWRMIGLSMEYELCMRISGFPIVLCRDL